MAQTTGFMGGKNCKIEISDDGSNWTDISGSSNAIKPGDKSRKIGSKYTFDGDSGLVTGGKAEHIEIEVVIVYTETASEAFDEALTIWEAGGDPVYLRWSPAGGTSGDWQYTTSAGIMTSFQYPESDAENADPIVCSLKVLCASVSKGVVT